MTGSKRFEDGSDDEENVIEHTLVNRTADANDGCEGQAGDRCEQLFFENVRVDELSEAPWIDVVRRRRLPCVEEESSNAYSYETLPL